MIKWFINDKEIRGNINGIYFSDNNRRLIINEVAVEDIGDYVCEATNKAGSDRHLYKAGFVILKIFCVFWVTKKKTKVLRTVGFESAMASRLYPGSQHMTK